MTTAGILDVQAEAARDKRLDCEIPRLAVAHGPTVPLLVASHWSNYATARILVDC